jgi:hypothetical protein
MMIGLSLAALLFALPASAGNGSGSFEYVERCEGAFCLRIEAASVNTANGAVVWECAATAPGALRTRIACGIADLADSWRSVDVNGPVAWTEAVYQYAPGDPHDVEACFEASADFLGTVVTQERTCATILVGP